VEVVERWPPRWEVDGSSPVQRVLPEKKAPRVSDV